MGSIAASIIGSVVSSVISSAIGGGRDRDERPAPAPAPAAPQAARAPDAGVTRQNTAAALRGPGTQSSTFLTGNTGVNDDQLNLGGNTLLGR